MEDKVLCQALPDLLRKTILTFCEGSVKFERKLEVIGSVHVRSDSEKVVTFLLDEQVYRYNNVKKEGDSKKETDDFSPKRKQEENKTRKEPFVVPKKRKLHRPMRNSFYSNSEDHGDEDCDGDFRHQNGERISREGIVFSPPRMIRRLQDYEDNVGSSVQSEESNTKYHDSMRNIENSLKRGMDISSYINASYIGEENGERYNNEDYILPNNEDEEAVFERRSRSTMLLTSGFNSICTDKENDERCKSTEVTSTKPDDVLNGGATDNDESRSSNSEMNEVRTSTPSLSEDSKQDDQLTNQEKISANPKDSSEKPEIGDVIQLPDTNMNYPAPASGLLQTQLSLAQNLAYPFMSLPLLQYSWPQTLVALAPPLTTSTPAVTSVTASSVQSSIAKTIALQKYETNENANTNQGQQQAVAGESWDRAVSCKECGKMLKSDRMLDLHMNTAHTHKTVYPCKQCGKVFYAASSLHSHKKRTHTSLENKFKCPHCIRFYAFQSELLRHIDTAHMAMGRSPSLVASPRSVITFNGTTSNGKPEEQSPSSCHSEEVKAAQEPVSQTGNLISEYREEDNSAEAENGAEWDYRFKCNECGMMLKSRECLNLHVNAKHTQKHAYPCSYCDKIFYAPSSRFCHIRRVHASKEQKFPCEYCDKVCTFHYELRNHIKLCHKDKVVPELMYPDSATPIVESASPDAILSQENG